MTRWRPFGARMSQKSDFRSLLAYTFFDLLTQNHLRKNSTFVPAKSPFLAHFFRKSAKNQNGKNHLRKKSLHQVADYESVTKNNP